MDFRYAVRILRRAPGFTAIAVLTLALGIGINTVVFTLYNAVAFKPIAARAPGELIRVGGSQNGRDVDPFTWAQYRQIQAGVASVDGLIATSGLQPLAGGPHDAEGLRVRFVSSNYFDVLGVAAIRGRTFVPQDRVVAVASYDFWTRRLGGDPAAVSRTIRTASATLEMIGVAPAAFAGTGVPPQMPDLWIPAAAQPEILSGVDWLRDPRAHQFQLLGRRKPGVTAAQVAAELDVLGRGWPLVAGKPARLTARPATFFQTDSGEFSSFGAVCGVLMVAVGLVLLIGCINLLNLFFARHAGREREFAVRRALGAGRARLVRQLCAESLLIGVAGGALGLWCSVWACSWISGSLAGFLRRISGGTLGIHLDLAPDWRVFAYTAAISLAAGVLVGMWPALRASRADVSSGLKQAAGGTARAARKRTALLALQVAGSLVLLTAAGLLFRGVWRSAGVDPGFDMNHLAGIMMNPSALVADAAARSAMVHEAAARIAALPEVASVAWTDRFPYLGHRFANFDAGRGAHIRCGAVLASDQYFATMGIPLLAGRDFRPGEIENPAPVVIVSESAAERAWPGEDPIGRQVFKINWLGGALPFHTYTVIGVVKSVRSTYLSKPDAPMLYFPKGPDPNFAALLVRTKGNPDTGLHAMERVLTAVNPSLPSQSNCFTLRQGPGEIQRMMAQAPAVVSIVLGGLALLLAAVGMFGLAAQLVARRTREIAIRISLGAQRGDVLRTVLGEALRPVALGALLGVVGAVGVSVLLRAMLSGIEMPDLTYGAGAFDPAVFAGALATLGLAVLMAMLWPARRAIGIAPAEALRNE